MSHIMTLPQKRQVQAASGVDVLAGVWLVVAPFILNYASGSNAMINDIVVGSAVLLLAGGQALSNVTESRWASWVNVILGGWLVAAPFVLGYASGTPMWNSIVLGIIIGGMALVSAFSLPEEEEEM